MEIKEAGCADLMADVLFFGKAGMLLLTGLTNPNVIETAHTLGVVAIIKDPRKAPPSGNNTARRRTADPSSVNTIHPL